MTYLLFLLQTAVYYSFLFLIPILIIILINDISTQFITIYKERKEKIAVTKLEEAVQENFFYTHPYLWPNIAIDLTKATRLTLSLIYFIIYSWLLLITIPATKNIFRNLVDFNQVKSTLLITFTDSLPTILTIFLLLILLKIIYTFIYSFLNQLIKGTLVVKGLSQTNATSLLTLFRILFIFIIYLLIQPHVMILNAPNFNKSIFILVAIISISSIILFANLFAGWALNLNKSLVIGSLIAINNHKGTIYHKSLFHLHLLDTGTNKLIYIPYLTTFFSTIKHLSSENSDFFTATYYFIVPTETSWQLVHHMLLASTNKIPLIAKTPPPYISYHQINELTSEYCLTVFCASEEDKSSIAHTLFSEIETIFSEQNIPFFFPS